MEGQHAASLAPPLPPVATLGSQRGEGEAGVVTGGRSGTRFVTEWERREAGGVVVKKSSLWVPLWVVGIEYFFKKKMMSAEKLDIKERISMIRT